MQHSAVPTAHSEEYTAKSNSRTHQYNICSLICKGPLHLEKPPLTHFSLAPNGYKHKHTLCAHVGCIQVHFNTTTVSLALGSKVEKHPNANPITLLD